jgi:aryl-alcohol dehydrogenase-like predicted oxidoreductase
VKYREFGRSSLQVSEIGLGGHREGVETRQGVQRTARFFLSAQERAKVVGLAIDSGVTYFDTTYGCEIHSLGESLRIPGWPDGLFVSGMRVDFFRNMLNDSADPRKYTSREVEGRLTDLGRDHMDQFLLGASEGGDPLGLPLAVIEDVLDELNRLRE